MAEHFKTYSAVFLIIIRDGKVLLQRRQNTGFMDGKLDFPGGHVDEGETASAAMVREAKEELGIDIKAEDLVFVHLQHRLSERTYYCIYYTANVFSGTPCVMEPDKCTELVWCDVDSLPADVIVFRKDVLGRIAKTDYYSEWIE